MTVSQPDGDGHGSSLAVLIWMMMIATMPLPSAPSRAASVTATVSATVSATSSGWQRRARLSGREETGAVRATAQRKNGVG